MYALGIDLGTTFTAAAICRDGRVEIAELGSRAAAIPSVVLLRDDETILTGESANRRGLTEPHRMAREFKRRLGDTTPILLGGTPYSAETLMSRLLQSVIAEVARREGGPPDAICISHPANWGPYKTDLLRQAVRLANIEQPVTFTTEPAAAAVFYAHQQRMDPDSVVAVYDLGGGTFDAAVLRKTPDGFTILGQPEGIERMGGVDFDSAVFHHVSQALGGKLAELDEDDPASIAAAARLREECVAAKEALSSDTDATISVLLPNIATEVRLTRAELEAMVRPALSETIAALRRALRSAEVTPEQLHAVLLVGGSSRMPLVAQLVSAELGRPVAIDAHPKHAVALGAAWLADGAGAEPTGEAATPPERTVGTAAVAPSAGAPPATRSTPASDPATAPAAVGRAEAPPAATGEPPATSSRRRLPWLVGVAVLAVVLLAGGVSYGMTRGDTAERPDLVGPGAAGASASPTVSAAPPDEQCTDEIKRNERWVCLASATLTDGQLIVEFEVHWAGGAPSVGDGYHVHLYGGDGVTPSDEAMAAHTEAPGLLWMTDETSPATLRADQVAGVVGEHPKICARIADQWHHLVPAVDGGYTTGNCVPISRV